MSYLRYGHPLEYFRNGVSNLYVYLHCGDSEYGIKDFVEDYGDDYKDDKSFIELIGRFIAHETGDEKYAWKMVTVLAKKLGVEKDLREKPLSSDEYFDMILGKTKKTRK